MGMKSEKNPVFRTRKNLLQVWLSDQERGTLDEISEEWGLNASDCVRQLIRQAGKRGSSPRPEE